MQVLTSLDMIQMKVKDVSAVIDGIVPLRLAQGWDNVGLLIGNPQQSVKHILLTIDVTKDVLAEARALNTDLIISYHPVIWDGLKRITTDGPTGVVYDVIRSGMAVFSIHTALDSAIGGVNDGLADIIGIRDAKPIGDYVGNPAGDNYKLVVFIPPVQVSKIVERFKKHTGAQAMGIVGDEKRLVKTAAVCAGSCGKIINSVIAAKADLYVTGELKHHQALAAQEAGLTCICLSHSVSERFILRKLAKQLQERLRNVTIRISKKDADPFTWKKL